MAKSKKGIRIHSVIILGETWQIELYTDETKFLVKVAESDPSVEALTDVEKKIMYFRQSHFNSLTVIHELVHCYSSMCCLEHSDINKNSYEEIMCDLVAKYGERLIKQSKEILRSLK